MAGDGLVIAAEAAQRVAEIHLQDGMPGHQVERAAVCAFGGGEVPRVAQRIAEIEMGGTHLRLQCQRATIALGGSRRVALRRLRIAEVEPHLGNVGVLGQGAPEAHDCVLAPPELAQRAGEPDQGFEIVRIGGEARLQLGDRALDSRLRKRHAVEGSAAHNNGSGCCSSGRSEDRPELRHQRPPDHRGAAPAPATLSPACPGGTNCGLTGQA